MSAKSKRPQRLPNDMAYVRTAEMTDDELAAFATQYGLTINTTKVVDDSDDGSLGDFGVFLFIVNKETKQCAASRMYMPGERPSQALCDKLIQQYGEIPPNYFD